MAESNPQSESNNPNSVSPVLSLGGGLPTSPDKVYRSVKGQAAIEDIHNSGVVRNAQSAGVRKQSRWGEKVFWSQGADGKNHAAPSKESFIIEAPHSVASQRQVRAEDITAVYGHRNGRTVNLLDQPEQQQSVRRSRGFSGEQAEKPKTKYRIGFIAASVLLYMAVSFDVIELALDSIGTAGFGIGVVIGYAKDIVSFVFFPVAFFLLGVPFWKGRKARKKMIAMISSYVISFIPWLGAIMPETFLAVAVTIYLSRAEDKQLTMEQTEDFVKSSTITRLKRIREKVRK